MIVLSCFSPWGPVIGNLLYPLVYITVLSIVSVLKLRPWHYMKALIAPWRDKDQWLLVIDVQKVINRQIYYWSYPFAVKVQMRFKGNSRKTIQLSILPILWLRDFTRSYEETFNRIEKLNRPLLLCLWVKIAFVFTTLLPRNVYEKKEWRVHSSHIWRTQSCKSIKHAPVICRIPVVNHVRWFWTPLQ